MKKKEKIIKKRTNSLLRDIIEIHKEEATAKKALRLLSKQQWSLEFLEYLVAKCAKSEHRNVQMIIKDTSGRQIILKSQDYEQVADADEDILMHLDNTAMVNDFIRRHSK